MAAQCLLNGFAGDTLGPKVNKDDVGIGSAGHDVEPLLYQRFRQNTRIVDHLLNIFGEARA